MSTLVCLYNDCQITNSGKVDNKTHIVSRGVINQHNSSSCEAEIGNESPRMTSKSIHRFNIELGKQFPSKGIHRELGS